MDKINKNKKLEKAYKLITRLERDLKDIEIQELIKGFTKEELEELGFIGDKEIRIERYNHKEGTEKEKLVFEAGVDFERCADTDEFENLDIENFIFLKNVKPAQLIATRSADESIAFNAGNNVKKEIKEDIEYYYAEKKGKVIIIRDSLNVLPSDIDCKIKISISDDKMKAFMSCTSAYGNGKKLTYELVNLELKRLSVMFGIDKEAISNAVDAANNTRIKQENVVIAKGRLAITGENGRIDFKFDICKEDYGFTVLPDGRIDYKNVSNINTTKKGNLLASLILPQQGIPGVDIFNEIVPADSGKEAILVAGNGVKVSEDGRDFFAEIDGQIVLNGYVLEIMNIYVVNGDLDYSTGNINFSGNVIIKGNVLEGFNVKADGDIVVTQNVEPARLEAGRDIIVKGGVHGRGKGLVSAGRDITVEFAQNARLEAQGNIYINKFAVNSCIYTSKYLKMQTGRGSFISGEIYALKGIDVKMLGSFNEIKTTVEIGTDFMVTRKVSEIDNVVEFCTNNIKKIDTVLKPLIKTMKEQPEALIAKGGVIKKSLERKKQLEMRCRTMRAKRNELFDKLNEKDVCFVKVSQTCFPGVYIKIRRLIISVTKRHENVRFYEDKKTGKIGIGAY